MNLRNAIATPFYLAHQASLAVLRLTGEACAGVSRKLTSWAESLEEEK